MHARQYHGIAADPYVMTDINLNAILIGCVSGCGMDGMAGCVNRYVGGHLAVVTDGHRSHIDDGAVVVGKEILPHVDMATVITIKGRVQKCSVGSAE